MFFHQSFHRLRILIIFITGTFHISACIHKAVICKLKRTKERGWHSVSPILDVYFPPSAMQQVLDNLKDLPSGTGAKDIDLIFLRGIMESPIVRSLAKVRHTLTPTTLIFCELEGEIVQADLYLSLSLSLIHGL